jgi:hypothetical protein
MKFCGVGLQSFADDCAASFNAPKNERRAQHEHAQETQGTNLRETCWFGNNKTKKQ